MWETKPGSCYSGTTWNSPASSLPVVLREAVSFPGVAAVAYVFPHTLTIFTGKTVRYVRVGFTTFETTERISIKFSTQGTASSKYFFVVLFIDYIQSLFFIRLRFNSFNYLKKLLIVQNISYVKK